MGGNPKYANYSKNISVITTKFQLLEFYYILLLRFGKPAAETYYNAISSCAIPVTHEQIKDSCIFKEKHKSKKLSYADCIGYVVSRNSNTKFLTGDKEFKNIPHVEFVK